MDKRALLAVVLSIIVLYAYQSFFMTVPMVEEKSELKQTEEVIPKETIDEKKEIVTEKPVVSKMGEEVRKSVGKKETITENIEEFIFEGNKYRAVLSNRGGGGLKSFKLNNYKQTLSKTSENVEMVRTGSEDILPLSIQFKGDGLEVAPDTVFEVNKISPGEIEYLWSSEEGIDIRKKYFFHSDEYTLDVEITVSNNGKKSLSGEVGIALYERYQKERRSRYDIKRQIVKTSDKLERVDYGKIKDEAIIKEGDIAWNALEERYFLMAVLADPNIQRRVVARRMEDNIISSTLEYEYLDIKPGSKKVIMSSVYIGPKEIDILSGVGRGLDQTIDLGRFHVIAEPLLRFLKKINAITGNYAYAIILVTLIIKVIFFPLANKSYRSMKDMQKLQPKIAEIREKYKDNREKMSMAIMELYRKNRVNPLGGCLPMVVQIPVFIALYNVLMNAIELRHAPFHFWIKDLSAKDPYFVTPVLMGVSMFLQQRMSPSAPDPTQQKVMMMMPLIFTVMFMNLPSGLVMYWLVNNLLSIAQQYYIMKKA